MIALGEQQLQHHPAILLQARRLGRDLHSFFNQRDAGGLQSSRTLHFHQAQPAGAHVGQTVEMA